MDQPVVEELIAAVAGSEKISGRSNALLYVRQEA
jgi:hypothetical protein